MKKSSFNEKRRWSFFFELSRHFELELGSQFSRNLHFGFKVNRDSSNSVFNDFLGGVSLQNIMQ